MPKAEILTIGTELLLGEIVDTNTQRIARFLREAGVDLYWTTTVGDNEGRIAEAVSTGLARSDILICTGGLGPTVDDCTREGIAQALGLELELHDELWAALQERFKRFGRTPTENNKRQSYLPQGAEALENAVGTAPGFVLEVGEQVIISMPGVPGEMMYIMEHGVVPYFEKRYGKGVVIRTRVLHTAGVPESQIDDSIADLERLQNPTVGLAAHAGSVDVRLTAKGESPEAAERMLVDLEKQVMQRLGDAVYGIDEETLARSVLNLLAEQQKVLAVIEKGLDGAVIKALTGHGNAFVGGEILAANLRNRPLPEITKEYAADVRADIVLGAQLHQEDNAHRIEIAVLGFDKEHHYSFTFGGYPQQAPEWSVNVALSTLRRRLLKAGQPADQQNGSHPDEVALE